MVIYGDNQRHSIRRQFLCAEWTFNLLPVFERVRQETHGSCPISNYCTYHVVT